jgi:hypothetical protein
MKSLTIDINNFVGRPRGTITREGWFDRERRAYRPERLFEFAWNDDGIVEMTDQARTCSPSPTAAIINGGSSNGRAKRLRLGLSRLIKWR